MTARHSATNAHPSPTSHLQHKTEETLLNHISAPSVLHKNTHLQFLAHNLTQGFPARYTSQDASQPWLPFWTLQSFSVLQVGLNPANKQRCNVSFGVLFRR
jgi:protein farnesyltransferase subunit beta